MDDNTAAVTGKVVEAVGKEAMEIARPVLTPAAETLGLVPRAIKAALAPLEKWILTREYNVEETKKLLEKKLENVDPETIVPPEPYLAVPAIQYISYCQYSEVLRDMYAELLAKSMQEATKDGVHPSYLEIIKQLCPDEAKFLKNLFLISPYNSTIAIQFGSSPGAEIIAFGGNTHWVYPFNIAGNEITPDYVIRFIHNLVRLGLVEKRCKSADEFGTELITKIGITKFGHAFCETCISK